MSSKLTGIGHLRVIRALRKAGFEIAREGKHVILRKENQFLSVPRHNPIKRFTLEGFIKDAGLSVKEFKKLL